VVLKVGSKDKAFELWFRGGESDITIDKIEGGKAVDVARIDRPICHLRTSAMLVDQMGLPEKEAKEDTEEPVVEDVDKEVEAEDFEEHFAAPTDKIAIVDASVVESIHDNELVEQAIIIPTKLHDAEFVISAQYDDTVLRSLTMEPAEVDDAEGEIDESISVMSHDNKVERKLRSAETIKGKQHMAGKKDKVAGRTPNPVKQAEAGLCRKDPERNNKRVQRRAMGEDIITDGVKLIKDLMEAENVEPIIENLNSYGLEFVHKTMSKMLLDRNVQNDKVQSILERVNEERAARNKEGSTELVEHVEWIRTKQREIRSQTLNS
jgi:hypothetical protein